MSTWQDRLAVATTTQKNSGDVTPPGQVMRPWPRILIVDALGEIRSRFPAEPAHIGWQIACAHSAGEAYRLVGPASRGAILMHVELPDESGWLAAAKLHVSAPRSRIWVCGDAEAIPTECLAMIGVAGYVNTDALPRWFGLFLMGDDVSLRPRNLNPERMTACFVNSPASSCWSR